MSDIHRLRAYGKKYITKEELSALLSMQTDARLHDAVSGLVEDGILTPVMSAGTNGNRQYPLFLKYRITLPAETFEAELREIGHLHPRLLRTTYLTGKPEVYRKNREAVQALNRWLFSEPDISVPISRKERSFEIFGQEKQLDDRTFRNLLDKLGIKDSDLALYDTPEYCFHDYIPVRKAVMVLLICENKDIWFNIRRMMFEERASVLFGVPIDGAVYGCGNKVSEEGALAAYTRFLGGAQVTYLYWGDIDRAGLRIFHSLCRNNPELDIRLFVPAYEEMLRLSVARPIPDSEDGRDLQDDLTDVLSLISPALRGMMQQLLSDNKRLPQEIIPFSYLKQNMR